MEMIQKAIFLFKQLFPLRYWSKYRDTEGALRVAVWHQWLGKAFWVKQYS